MTGRQDKFQQAINQGHSAAWDQLWDKAAHYYQQALEEFPDHPGALTSLGLALVELKRYPEALDCYRRAAAVTPADPLPQEKIGQLSHQLGFPIEAVQAYLAAADLYLKKNDVAKAVECWERAAAIDPLNLQAHSRLAIVFERQGRKAEAVEEYLAVASLIRHSGDTAKAFQAVNYALQIIPENPQARKAISLLKNGEELPLPAGIPAPASRQKAPRRPAPEPAAQQPKAEPAEGLDPVQMTRQRALALLAGIFFESSEAGAGAGPRRDLNAVLRGSGEATPEQIRHEAQVRSMHHLGQAINAQAQGQGAVAQAELARAVESGFTHPAAHFMLGYLAAQADNPAAALPDLQTSVRNPDFALASRLLLAQVLEKTDRLSEAAVEYLEALKLADSQTVPPNQAAELRQLYEPLAESLRQQTDLKTLATACESLAIQLLRPDWQEHLRRSRQQMSASAPGSQPLPLAEMILEAHSNQVIDSLARIRSLSNESLLRAAMEEAYYTLESAPTYLPLHVQMAEILLQENRVEDAVAKFTLVAQAYSLRGQPDQSVTLLRRLIALSPMDLSLRSRLIEQLEASDQSDDALKCYLELGELYYHQAELDKARLTFIKALPVAGRTSDPRKGGAELLRRIADLDMQRLDWRQAARWYEQMRLLQPDDSQVRLNLIDLSLRMGQEKAALAELEAFLTRLETAHRRDQAIAFLKSLTEEHPDWVEGHKHLALLQMQENENTTE